LEGIGEVEEEGLVRQERLDQSQNRDEGIFKEGVVHTKGFFFSWVDGFFGGVWEKQGGINFVGLVAMCECQVEVFLSFLLLKKN